MIHKKLNCIFVLVILCQTHMYSQESISVSRIKYDGGGDWYGNRTTFVNLFQFIRENTNVNLVDREQSFEISDKEFFGNPIAYIAGHGNIKFSEEEASRLRNFLTNGGFLWADDDYGMDSSFRREMKKVFPTLEWVELPFSHPIYHTVYHFNNGLPKIHEHDGGPPKGLGLIYEGHLVTFYSLNTDISDGCEDYEIHSDPEEKREEALKMGTNIIVWALTH
jgi:hypothetical protein